MMSGLLWPFPGSSLCPSQRGVSKENGSKMGAGEQGEEPLMASIWE